MDTANSLKSIETNLNIIKVLSDKTITKICFMSNGIVRVRTTFGHDFPERSLGLAYTAWNDYYDELIGGERTKAILLCPDINEDKDSISLKADNVLIKINRNPFSISIGTFEKELFSDVPGRAYRFVKGIMEHTFKLDDSCFYGFGEKTGPIEKTGMSMRMSNRDAYSYDPINTDPLYKHVPFFIKLDKTGENACGIYYNTACDCHFDIGKEHNGYWPGIGQFSVDDKQIDMFFINGPKIPDVVKRFSLLTGKSVMLPRYALGYQGSTMFYSELPENCDKTIVDFVRNTKIQKMPCTTFMLSSGYTTDQNGKRNVFSWNIQKFPDPKRFVQELLSEKVFVTPNIKPGILDSNPVYKTFADNECFIRNENNEPMKIKFWGGQGSLVDFANPKARVLWKEHLNRSLFSYGISSLWNDNNEFDISDDAALCSNDGAKIPAQDIKADLPTLMVITGKEALLEKYPENRPYLLTRSGGTGIGRYAQTWTGDNYTSWDSLKYNIATVLGASISGMPNTGNDIGGFAGPVPKAELLTRWIWVGVFLPRFSIHSANDDNTVTEPWMYESQIDNVRRAFEMRDRLQDYLYSLMYMASRHGTPIIRPMIYDYQTDINCRKESIDFMLGDALLVAPVVQKGAVSRSVYIPEGAGFWDYYSYNDYAGGTRAEVPAPLDRSPLFVKKGSIFTISGTDSIDLVVSLGGDCEFTLYEDDGITNSYKNGEYLESRYTAKFEGGMLKLSAEYFGNFKVDKAVDFIVKYSDLAPKRVFYNQRSIKQYFIKDQIMSGRDGWIIDYEKKECHIIVGNGRDMNKIIIDFGYFDLIGM